MMTVTRGNQHEYLGMILDYSEPRKVKIDMQDYVQKILNDFIVNLDDQKAKKSAAEHMFNVRENANKLNKKKAQEFHTMVKKSLFL